MDWRWLVVVSVIGCGPAVDLGEGGDTDDPSSSGGDPSTTASTTATTVMTSVGTDPSTSGPGTSGSSTVSATDPSTVTMTTEPGTATFTTTTASTTDPTGGELPDGETCEADEQCASGRCFLLGILGGICGECITDSDCDGGGCTPPNPIESPPIPSSCNDGGFGAGCMSDDVCTGELICATVLDVPGVISASTCSECATDGQCDAGQLCAPDIAVAALTGVYRCVGAGSLSNGQSCDFATSGDQSCASGFCAVADVMSLLSLGVCSACETDAQCVAPQQCEPPQVDLVAGLIPGSCQ